ALSALARVVAPGGRLLFGDGFWTRPPSAPALGIFGEDLLGLPELLEDCRARGWRVIHVSEADQREWDDFESTSRAGRQEWLLANADDPRAPEIREWLDTRERQYVDVYRGGSGSPTWCWPAEPAGGGRTLVGCGNRRGERAQAPGPRTRRAGGRDQRRDRLVRAAVRRGGDGRRRRPVGGR